MGFFGALFGPSKSGIKRQLSRQLNSRYVRNPVTGKDNLLTTVEGWNVTLDIDSSEGPPNPFFGPKPVTRIGIPYRKHREFDFSIRRRGLVGKAIYDRRLKWDPTRLAEREVEFAALQAKLTPPDFAFGFGEFDYEFSMETSDEPALRDFIQSETVRSHLQGLAFVHLSATHDDEWFNWLEVTLPHDIDVLYFLHYGYIRDIEQLRRVHDLLVDSVRRLGEIGVASPTPPDFVLGAVLSK